MAKGNEAAPAARTHAVNLINREHVEISGVEEVDSFNEEMIVLVTSVGAITLLGSDLHISTLNLDSGELIIDGQIAALEYDERMRPSRAGLLGRMFK